MAWVAIFVSWYCIPQLIFYLFTTQEQVLIVNMILGLRHIQKLNHLFFFFFFFFFYNSITKIFFYFGYWIIKKKKTILGLRHVQKLANQSNLCAWKTDVKWNNLKPSISLHTIYLTLTMSYKTLIPSLKIPDFQYSNITMQKVSKTCKKMGDPNMLVFWMIRQLTFDFLIFLKSWCLLVSRIPEIPQGNLFPLSPSLQKLLRNNCSTTI